MTENTGDVRNKIKWPFQIGSVLFDKVRICDHMKENIDC